MEKFWDKYIDPAIPTLIALVILAVSTRIWKFLLEHKDGIVQASWRHVDFFKQIGVAVLLLIFIMILPSVLDSLTVDPPSRFTIYPRLMLGFALIYFGLDLLVTRSSMVLFLNMVQTIGKERNALEERENPMLKRTRDGAGIVVMLAMLVSGFEMLISGLADLKNL